MASKVGVSEATVSRVLNGKPGVSAATRESVLTALDVLGYERPTQLRGDRARLVGLVLPELQNPIFPALAEVVGGGLAQRGFTPVLCTRTAGGLSEAEYVRMYCQRTGREAIEQSHWDFYMAYNLFRIAAILQGIAKRVVDGTAASDHARDAGSRARPMAELGWQQVEKILRRAA